MTELRACDADRDRVVDVLRVAAGDGRLTVDELDERLEAALSARSVSELAVLTVLTADLVARPDRPAVATAEPGDVVRIDQRGGSVRRTGRWVVPRQLEMRPSWCDVTLDVTDAVIMHDMLSVRLTGRMRYGQIEERWLPRTPGQQRVTEGRQER